MPPFDAGALAAQYDALAADAWRGFAAAPSLAEAARRQADLERAQARELRRQLGAALRTFAATFGWREIVVPGTHPGGIGNQDLFDLLADRGWRYGADTRRLRDHVRVTLLSEFEDATTVPLRFEVEQVAVGAVLEWIARRLDRDVTDIDRPALAPAYARAKRRRFGSGRAGSASGALAAAVRRGRLVLT